MNLSEVVPKELADLQLGTLKWSVRHACENSALYTEKLGAAGVKPEDIQTLHDVRGLPFTAKAELRRDCSFGWC